MRWLIQQQMNFGRTAQEAQQSLSRWQLPAWRRQPGLRCQ